MRIRYHGSKTQHHGLGYVLGYMYDPQYLGGYTLVMDTGVELFHARRESFTLLDDDETEEIDTLAELEI